MDKYGTLTHSFPLLFSICYQLKHTLAITHPHSSVTLRTIAHFGE